MRLSSGVFWLSALLYQVGYASQLETDSGFLYQEMEDAVFITGYRGSGEFVVSIPSVINGKVVTEIAAEAFRNVGGVAELIIPDTVTRIGVNAFSDSSIGTFHIGSGVSSIFASAFSGIPGLTRINVDFENRVFSSKDGVLYNFDKTVLYRFPPGHGNRESFTVPATVEEIIDFAFDGALVREILFPEGLRLIGSVLFGDVTTLKRCTFLQVRKPWRKTPLRNVPNLNPSVSKRLIQVF